MGATPLPVPQMWPANVQHFESPGSVEHEYTTSSGARKVERVTMAPVLVCP